MPSPKARRGSAAGRVESPTVPARPRRVSGGPGAVGSALGGLSSGGPGRLSLSLPFLTVALKSLLAVDLWLSRRLGLCAAEDALLASVRPLVRLVTLSGHGLPWMTGTLYLFAVSETAVEQEMMVNLFIALLLDRAVVGIVKAFFHYRWPEILAPFPPNPRHRFPSGHATRAAMCARFLHARLLVDGPVRALALAWAALLGLSQVLLGQHNVTGVALALTMGYWQYSLVERCWVSIDWLQDILLTVLGDSLISPKG